MFAEDSETWEAGSVRGAPARLGIDGPTARTLWHRLPLLAGRTVTAITAEVPSYSGALTGQMRQKIENAVQIALGTFLSLMVHSEEGDPSTPLTPALEAAYALGSGEARAGRSMDALLAAYRVGARVAWREMSTTTVKGGLSAATVAEFAELMFAYIDELSAASVAGHADELASVGRARRRNLERLTHFLLAGADEEVLRGRAEQADWPPPQTLTAVLLPRSQVRAALARLDPDTLDSAEELPGLDPALELAVLLVPEMHGTRRAHLLRTLTGLRAVVGPARPWHRVADSHHRAVRGLLLGPGPGRSDPGSGRAGSGRDGVGSGRGETGAGRDGARTGREEAGPGRRDAGAGREEPVDTDRHLAELLLGTDPEALADLRAQVLAPLAELPPATAYRLAETLRAWLLRQGRREQVATDLIVHPQTVRYRMGQLRELYGDRLDDPRWVLDLTVALAFLTPPGPATSS